MNSILRKAIAFLLLLTAMQELYAQEQPPFYNEIQQFKKQDSANFPPAHAILFVGSSSFTKWQDVQSYFPAETIINRGFGGSELRDLIRYANDIIVPYHPKQIVIYAGENDLAYSDTVTAQTVFSRVVILFNMLRSSLPGVPIIYLTDAVKSGSTESIAANPLFDQTDSLLTRERLVSAVRPPRKR